MQTKICISLITRKTRSAYISKLLREELFRLVMKRVNRILSTNRFVPLFKKHFHLTMNSKLIVTLQSQQLTVN